MIGRVPARNSDRPSKEQRELAKALGHTLCTHDLKDAEEDERDDGSFRWHCEECDAWAGYWCASCDDTLPGRRPRRGVCDYCRVAMKPPVKPTRAITFEVADGWGRGFNKAERAIKWLENNRYKVHAGHIPGCPQ